MATVNYGRAGGMLEPKTQVTFRRGMFIHQFTILVREASRLMRAGYGVEADRVLDLLMDWKATGESPEPEDLEFLDA